MATGYVTMRTESIPGNETNSPTMSTKRIYFPAISFTPTPGPNPMERDDELRGIDEPLAVIPESYAPTWALESRAYPDTMGALLCNSLGMPTSTAGNGVIVDPDSVAIPVGATRHVWTAPFGPSGASPKTAYYQVAYKDQSVFYDVKGAACQTLTLTSPATGGCRVAASGPALYIPKPVADPALTPAYESLAIPPFERSHLTLPTWLSSTATSTEDFSLTITNPATPYASLGVASKWPDVMEKGDLPIIVTGSIPKRNMDADDINALMDSTGFAAKVRWTSTSIIATAYPYKMFVEFANAQYVAGAPSALENKRRIGATLDFKGTSAGSAGSVTVTLINATASYT